MGPAETRVSVVSVLSISVRDGADLEGAFARLEIFEHSHRSGGFRRGRLLRPVERGDPYLVVAEWENAEAYRRWLDNPVRAEIGDQLEPLLAGDVASGELYEEV
jgi:heme-degrading monooxygenase HmoA